MKVFRYLTDDPIDVAVVYFSSVAYVVALSTTAIAGFWHGPDFDHPSMSGLDCLLAPLAFPLGWLANPTLFAAVALLLLRCRIAALVIAAIALGLTHFWTWEFQREFPATLLLSGYDWWMMSARVLALGSLMSVLLHFPDSVRSMKCCLAGLRPALVDEKRA